MKRPSPATTRVLVNSALALVIGFGAMAVFLWWLRPEADHVDARLSEGAVSVSDLAGLPSHTEQDVTVSGFVFVGRERTILCGSRDREDQPYCVGPAITVTGLDTSRLDLVAGRDHPSWSRDEVTLLGRFSLLTLSDPEIVQ